MLAYPSWTQPAYGFSPYGRPQRDENGIFAPVTTDTVPLAARRAAELRLAGKNVQAIQQYRAVLAVMPDHRLINHNLGAMLMEAGEHEAALPYLERSLVDCRDLQPHISYGWALLGLGHAAKAHAFLAQAVGRFGHSHPYLNILRSRASSLLQQADAAGVAPVRKVFCIGHNKTGTTSIDVALRSAGYRAGTQIEGERLIDDWAHGRFERIIDLCCQGDAFQDIPFSLKHTYRVLDETFP
ncbi:MAG: hypothetical protein JO142_11400, partial [Burkholderiales bacterium]|nr:hypothetical protein [Burkholderiales bacterium]